MKKTIVIILVAAIGGVFSNLIDVARRLQSETGEMPSMTYWLGCLIWAVLGVFVAMIWGEKNLQKVFYIGLGLPSLLQVNIGNFSGAPGPDLHAALSSPVQILAPSAYAQPGDLNIPGRTITFVKTGTSPDKGGYRVIFYACDGTEQTIQAIAFGNEPVPVPNRAANLAVEYRGARSGEKIALTQQPDVSMRIEVDVATRGWSGFLQSIGVRSAAKYKVAIKLR